MASLLPSMILTSRKTISVNKKQRLRHWAASKARTTNRWLSGADNALSALYLAREGSVLSRGLAVASVVGVVAKLVFPAQQPSDYLRYLGYEEADTALGALICAGMIDSDEGREELFSKQIRIIFWDIEGESRAIAAIYRDDELETGPFFLKGSRNALVLAARKVVWGQGSDIMLTTRSEHGDNPRRESLPFALVKMEDPGPYYGDPGVDWYVNRIKAHDGSSFTRSMLLTGPTGVGKSTLGRLVARELDHGKTLKIAGRALPHFSPADVVDLVNVLQPSVLLLDDISMIDTGGEGTGVMLEMLESLHGKAKVIIATLMMDGGHGGARSMVPLGKRRVRRRRNPSRKTFSGEQDGDDRGGQYFSGMRPGRIDEVIKLKRPSDRMRRLILLHYLGGEEEAAKVGVKGVLDDIVERCGGLTGAYLKEVAYRLRVHGIKSYKSEIINIKASCPHDDQEAIAQCSKRLSRQLRRGKSAQQAVDELLAELQVAGHSIIAPSRDLPATKQKAEIMKQLTTPKDKA